MISSRHLHLPRGRDNEQIIRSSPTAIYDSSNNADHSVPSLEPKRADTNISNKDVSSLNTDEQILHELRQLNRLYRVQAQLTGEKPLKTQALWNFLLQAFGLVVGTLFGAFAILAWKATTQANDKSDTAIGRADAANSLASAANQIALAAYCESQTDTLCSSVQRAASRSISSFALQFYGVTSAASTFSSESSATPTSSAATTTPSSASSSLPSSESPAHTYTGAIVGGVLGGIAAVFLIGLLPYLTFRAKKKRYDDLAPMIPSRYDE